MDISVGINSDNKEVYNIGSIVPTSKPSSKIIKKDDIPRNRLKGLNMENASLYSSLPQSQNFDNVNINKNIGESLDKLHNGEVNSVYNVGQIKKRNGTRGSGSKALQHNAAPVTHSSSKSIPQNQSFDNVNINKNAGESLDKLHNEDGANATEQNVEVDNNPSVSSADSSLYTREPSGSDSIPVTGENTGMSDSYVAGDNQGYMNRQQRIFAYGKKGK